jgi:hypothetical protein
MYVMQSVPITYFRSVNFAYAFPRYQPLSTWISTYLNGNVHCFNAQVLNKAISQQRLVLKQMLPRGK